MEGMSNQTGRAIELAQHVRQSIANILATPVGTLVMHREYGSVLPYLIDQPLNDATVLRLYAAAVAAITRWEDRVTNIRRISDISTANPGTASLRLRVQIIDGAEIDVDAGPLGGAA